MITIGSLSRICADHTDGTVSGYSSGGSVTPTGLEAPEIDATPPDSDGSYIELNWDPAVNNAGQTATGYNLQWHGSGDVGQGWTPIENPSSGMGFDIGQGQSGEFRLQPTFADGTATEWGYSGMVTEAGGSPITVSANATAASDTEIDLTFSCNPGTGDYTPVAYSVVYAPYDAPAGSGSVVTLDDASLAQGATGSAEVTGLTPGTHYDFLVVADWHPETQDDLGTSSANVDATTQGTVPTTVPAAPASIRATLGKAWKVQISWANSSNNEDGFILERSLNNGAFTQLAKLGPDTTSYTDDLSSVPIFQRLRVAYRVRATLSSVSSARTGSAIIMPSIGGPDITANLNAMASDVAFQFSQLSWFQKAWLSYETIVSDT